MGEYRGHRGGTGLRTFTLILTLGLGAQSGGMTNCTPEAAQRPGTRCHPARGRKHLSSLVSFHPRWPKTGQNGRQAPDSG